MRIGIIGSGNMGRALGLGWVRAGHGVLFGSRDLAKADVPDPKERHSVHFSVSVPSLAERLAADVPGARVVKAFNTMPAEAIDPGRETLTPHRISVFLCSDDDQAKTAVSKLAEELGFVGVDSGELERAQLVEAVADFIRFQVVTMGLGAFATISVNVLPI